MLERALLAGLLLTAVAFATSVAPALAVPPILSIESPSSGEVTGDTHPLFSGVSNDTEDAVTIKVFRNGSFYESAQTTPHGDGGWSLQLPSELDDASYSVEAEQIETLTGEPGYAVPVGFTVDTQKPSVTLNGIPSPTNDSTPSFSGTASDPREAVTVYVFRGSSPGGSLAAEVSANPSGGGWSSSSVGPLGDGTYTAIAEQKSSIGNEPGFGEPTTFEIHASKPNVSLNGISSPTGDRTPSFSGSASEGSTVVVRIYDGGSPGGSPVAEAQASGTGGSWDSGPASPALANGSYTAVAEQESGFGNGPGVSGAIHFTVETAAPALTLKPFRSPSNERSPRFSGTTSDTKRVVVQVFQGGESIAKAEATPSGSKWETGPVSPELPTGEHSYTVVATEQSSIAGNPEGRAESPYVLDTLPPAVTITPIATPSKETKPIFRGTASDTGPVTFVVKLPGGKEVFKETVPMSAGAWSIPAGKLTLPATKASYTATATQSSSLGNEAGVARFEFVVDPLAPNVTLALVKSQFDTSTPTFTGTASETTPVHVAICTLPTTECRAEPREPEAESAAGGDWSATLTQPLADGEYEAVAWQKTEGGSTGAAAPQDFTIDTVAPIVSVQAPAQGATVSGSTVSFHGTSGTAAHDVNAVTVQLFAGASAGGTAAQTVTVPASGGEWSATLGGLVPGQYTVLVSQGDEAGNVGTSTRSFTDVTDVLPAGGPTVGFSWFPSQPRTGELVTLVSTSSDATSPIAGYAWNVTGTGFTAGAQRRTITFTTPGSHAVQLRVTDGTGRSGVSLQQIPVSFPLMRPFPTVRILATRSGGRLHLKVLSVEAPAGANVTVLCKGTGCPVRTLSRAVVRPKGKSTGLPVLTFPRLQRALPAGVALEIRITQAGRIGKYTRFAVRKGRLPLRSDACVSSTEPKPIPCA